MAQPRASNAASATVASDAKFTPHFNLVATQRIVAGRTGVAGLQPMHVARVAASLQDDGLIEITDVLEAMIVQALCGAHWKKLRTRTSVSASTSISSAVV